ncbi:MAG TPA: M56 family metallopeptidase, partial [Planctomycetaceae bacterium]|nr:M56 family metallopeptidase [Planctomycetaceae bacterium]
DGVRVAPAVHDRSSLAADDKWPSIPFQKNTGGPKLPPVAPDPNPAPRETVSARPLPTHESPFPWALALVSVWATGIAFIASRSAWAYVRFVRRFPASGETPPEWADEWTSLQLEAGLPGIVPLVVAEHAGPVLCRLPRGYRLIVPADAWRTLEPSQRLLILRHEMAHIERHDVWKSLAMRILALPHWFNPLVWHIVRRFDESAEWACDEAAAGAAPDRIPDYARALLQLSHRAQPVFFATSAARTSGLAHRIRRLLTPAANKGTKMKTTLMAGLLLGISLVNVTRLETRAEGSGFPPTADAQKNASPDLPATADTPSANIAPAVDPTWAGIHVDPRAYYMERRIAGDFVDAKPRDALPASAGFVADLQPVVATPPPQTRVEAGPSAAGKKTKTPPAAAAPPIKMVWHTLRPGQAVQVTGKGAMRVQAGSSVVEMEMLDGEVRFGPGPDRGVDVISMPREARVNLPYILEHMRQYQREREELKASLAEMEKWQETEGNRLAAVNKRLEEEKDPVVRSFLEKGIAQSGEEMQREHRKASDKLIQRENEMFQRNLQRIMDEIARYAKEHKILVVRRMPVPNEKRAGAAPTPVAPPPAPVPLTGGLGAPPLLPPARTPAAAAAPSTMFTFAVVGPTQAAPMRIVTPAPPRVSSATTAKPNSLSGPWDQEILYVAEVRGALSPDISDEIVKRLNAADEAKGKASSAPTK